MNDYTYLDDEFEALPKTGKMSANKGEPVNSHHDLQTRTECAINRFRKMGITK